MTGVREYLENQLEFLNTKLGIISDYNVSIYFALNIGCTILSR